MEAISYKQARFPADSKILSYEQILENVKGIQSMLQARGVEIDELRRIPEDIIEKVRQTGAFRMMMPHSWGGSELNPMQINHILEELSVGNASVAWCVMIQNDGAQYSGYLDDGVARQMYPSVDMATSNVVQPRGRAVTVDGGFIVNGLWPFASGCMHTDWFAGGCHVYVEGDDRPQVDSKGVPIHCMILARRDDFHIHDTWNTTGLRGTGSHDIEAHDLFVPKEHSFSFNMFENVPRPGPLYLWPSILNAKMPGVVLGIARNAIETVVDYMKERKVKSERVSLAVADAQTHYASARAYVYASLEALWDKLTRQQFPNEQERIAIFLSRTNAFHASRAAVQLMYDVLGGEAVYTRKYPLDRNLRDINTACQHILGQRKAQQAAAELFLGVLDKPFPFL